MNTNPEFNNQQPNQGSNINDGASATAKDRYYNSVRSIEDKEAQFASRLEKRQLQAKTQEDHVRGLIDARTTEYQQDRAQIKQALSTAKLDLDAAHRSAAEHCAEISVKYVPGQTTEADVLRVPVEHEAEVAKKLNLPFGMGINVATLKYLKWILAACCLMFSSLSLGLFFKQLNPRNLLGNPGGILTSLIMGGLITVGLIVLLMPAWKSIGSKFGSGRPRSEAMTSAVIVSLMTAGVFLALAFFDAYAFQLLSAAKAALNPAMAIPTGVAILLGCVCSGLYVLGLSFSNFAQGYNEAARESIDGYMHTDETGKREAAKQTVPVKTAIDALGHVKVVEERIHKLDTDLQKLDQEFKRDYAELTAALPTMPTEYEPHEQEELDTLRQRMHSDKTKYEAHVQSRA